MTKSGNGKRYMLHCMKETYNPLDVCEGDYENFEITTDLHGLIYMHYYHSPDPKIKVLTEDSSNDGNGKWLIWLPDEEDKPPSKSQGKKSSP